MPLYNSKEEAEEKAEEMGGSGSHEHTLDGETVYMPFESHEQIMEIMGDKEEEEREHTDDHDEEKYHDDDEEKYHDDEDSEDEKDKMKEEDSEDEEKYMSLDDFLRELRQFNK